MTPALHDIARALVAEPAWRWMPGMLASSGAGSYRIIEVWPSAGRLQVAKSLRGKRVVGEVLDGGHLLPNLTDPATLGCILALVREASRTPTLHMLPQSWRGEVRWRVASARVVVGGELPSEAAALLAALRACPAPVTAEEVP